MQLHEAGLCEKAAKIGGNTELQAFVLYDTYGTGAFFTGGISPRIAALPP